MSNITFSGIAIGDYGELTVNTSNEVEVHKIPRADGAILRRRGGGLKTLTISSWIKRDTKAEVESYFDQLAGILSSAIGDLVVNGVTYSNCLLKSVSPDSGHNTFSAFTVTFIKSGD